jgi:hypothetical protein
MRTLNDYFLTAKVTDISTAGSSFVAVPDGGKIIKILTSIKNAITTADADITFEIGGTAVTGGDITITQSGSAAGDVDSSEPTAANSVEEGDAIEIISDGGSSTACEMIVTFVIRR